MMIWLLAICTVPLLHRSCFCKKYDEDAWAFNHGTLTAILVRIILRNWQFKKTYIRLYEWHQTERMGTYGTRV